MMAISVTNLIIYTNITVLFSLLHTSEISQGTEYEYELFVSHRYFASFHFPIFFSVFRFSVKRKID